MEGAQARRVLLVVPKGSTVFHEPLNLRILRRYADNLALQLGLVSRDSRTRRMAKEEGIPVLLTLRGGRRGRWRFRTPHRSSAESAAVARVEGLRAGEGDRGYGDRIIVWASRGLAVLLFVALLLLVVGIAALTVPQAEVTLVPYRQIVEVNLSLRADPDVEDSSLTDLTVPARILEAEVEDSGQVSTASTKDAPDAPAVGQVTFINQAATPLTIEPGAVVRTATGTTVRFRTVTTATLPAAIGGTAQAEIEALEAGPVGNVPANTIAEVETSGLRGRVRVINERPTQGGGVKQVGYVTRADMDRLHAQLLQQLQQRAYVELQNQLGEQEFLPPQSMSVEILAEVYDQFLDAEADTLGLQMRILATGTAVHRADLNLLAYEALMDRIPATHELKSELITFTRDEENVTMEGRAVLIDVNASAPLIVEVDRSEVRSAIAGLKADEAREVLENTFTLNAPPSVVVMPDWIKRWEWLDRVPYLPFRIQVILLE
ncbi:MAG: baseplate J/gp47 family protein [Anaerolineae bacterium]